MDLHPEKYGKDALRDIEIAKAMKAQGCTASLITTCTGITEEEIARL